MNKINESVMRFSLLMLGEDWLWIEERDNDVVSPLNMDRLHLDNDGIKYLLWWPPFDIKTLEANFSKAVMPI